MSVALNGLPKRLVNKGLLLEEKAQRYYAQAAHDGVSYVNYLLEHHLVESKDIAAAVSEEFGIPLFEISAFDSETEAFKLIDAKLIREHNALPLFKRGKKLFVAVSDPSNLNALDQFKFHSGLNVEPVLTEALALSQIIDKAVESQESALPTLEDTSLDDLEFTTIEDDKKPDIVETDVDDAPIVRFVNKLLVDAIKKGASDVHFEPYENRYRIRVRIDGILEEIANPPPKQGERISARLKVMARLDISERRLPQDGRMKLKLTRNRSIDFRVSTLPILYGEKVVLRILDSGNLKFGADTLGMEEYQKKLFVRSIQKSQGMVLITGPTGSGKTVTLYSALSILNTNDRNIATAEDPAEIYMQGVNQVNINPKVGLDFASALRSFLRQDPDVIMVGEVRDTETAEIAMKAAQTGHMVLSTLHTNNAPQTLTRLINMGVEPYNIVASVSLIIAQRLVRQLCPICKVPVELPDEVLLRHGFTQEELGSFVLYGPEGCDQCNSGYKERIGIFEVLPVTESIAKIILNGGNSTDIEEQAVKDGVVNLRQSGLRKVKEGLTSLEEIDRVTSE